MEKTIKYSQNDQPRTPGYWQGKVKIAEDFEELPEHIAAAFRGEVFEESN
jgi:hypothetical protein